MNIEKIVNRLIRKYGTRNPFELADYFNTIVVFAPLKGVRGFYQYFQRNNLIYIDSDLPEHERRLVCAHELGHLILHKRTNTFAINTYTSLNTVKYEKEANLFAVNLLISSEDLRDYGDFTVDQLSRIYGYDPDLIKLRLGMEG